MNVSTDVLAQFNQLEQSGALETLGELRKENRELDKIIIDASLLVSYTNINDMLDFIIRKLLDHFIPEFLAFLVHPPRGDGLLQYCYRNLKKSNEKVSPLYYTMLIERFSRLPAFCTFKELEAELGADVFDRDFRMLDPDIIFPMTGIGGIYGIAILGKKIIRTNYTVLEQKYIDRMVRFLSVGIQNGLHYESSITDPKTGLYTHDFFVRRLDEAVALAKRHNTCSGILMLDVDHFKKFNDTWGHVTGDKVLMAMAEVLKIITRTEDCAARFGGEEFSVLVTDCTPEGLMLVSERIRIAVSEIRLPEYQDTLFITVSIGARMVEAGKGTTSMILIGDADKALYKSKHDGRNRSTLFMHGLLERAAYIRGLK